ncbi:MAG: CHAT domain-containing protein [Chloroflexota bacterium]
MTPAELVQDLLQPKSSSDRQRRLAQLAPQLNLDTLRHLASLTYETQFKNAQKALQIAQLGLQIAQTINTPDAIGMAQWNLGNVHQSLNNYDAALDCFAQAQSFYEANGKTQQAVALKINRVGIYCSRGAYDAALALAAEAEATCQAIGEPAEVYLANLQLTLGWVHEEVGDFAAALQAYAYGRSLFTKHNDPIRVALIDVNRAHLHKVMDEFATAETLLHAAHHVLAEGGHTQEVARVDLNLGLLAFCQGQYQQALAALLASYDSFSQMPLPVEMANVNLVRSDVYGKLNLYTEMVEMAAEAAPVFRSQRMKREYTRCLLNQGIGYLHLGLWSLAERFLGRARRQAKKHSTPIRLATVDLVRAELALRTGQPQRALRIARRVAGQHGRLQKPSLTIQARLLQAESALALTPPRRAQASRWLTEADDLAAQFQLIDGQIKARRLLAENLVAQADMAGAAQLYQQAFELVEKLRLHFTVDELQLGYLANQQAVFTGYLALRHRQFLTGEVGLADLLAALQASSQAALPLPSKHDLPETAVPQLAALQAEWHWYGNRLAEAETKDDLVELQRKRQAVERKLGQLHRQIRLGEQKGAATAVTLDEAVTAASLQTHLAAGEGLLHIYEADDAAQALILTQHGAELVPDLVPLPQLKQQLESWRNFIQHAAGQPDVPQPLVQAQLKRLHDSLIRPLSAKLAALQHLFVLLPATWHDLPLAGLYDGHQFWAEQCSLTRLSMPQQLQKRPSGAELAGGNALLVGFSGNGRLPATVQEVPTIAAQLGRHWRTEALLEEEATVRAVQQAAVSAALIHLATHAEFRPDNSLFSWVQLADARLTAADIYHWRLGERPLVVLSACESGRGQAQGSGLLGFGRSFLAAGAGELLQSLWRIEDSATAELMRCFYQHYQHGQHVAGSLRQMQQWAIARQFSPLTWAAFVHLAG